MRKGSVLLLLTLSVVVGCGTYCSISPTMELGRRWVEKNQRTTYRPLVGQNVPSEADMSGSNNATGSPVYPASSREGLEALRQWSVAGPAGRAGMLDLRPHVAFADAHLAGATSLPWGDNGEVLVARAHELPPRGAKLVLVSDDMRTLDAACSHLLKSGYQIQFGLHVPDGTGHSIASAVGIQWGSDISSVRLWRPSPCLTLLLPLLTHTSVGSETGQPFVAPVALDIGCG